MADIFLSYDHDDSPRILPLVAALERSGWNVWWDHRILPGQTWDQTIKRALDEARCVVVVWTHYSVQSDWVRIEANNGHERRILVPVMLDAAVELPLAFQLVQAAPLFDWNGSPDDLRFQKLVAGIRAVLGDGVAAAPVPAPPTPPVDSTEPRALDAAIGRQLPLNEPANLIAMIRRAESRGLKAILESDDSGLSPEDVASRPFDLAFPADAAGRRLPAQLTIHINAPDFDPPSQQKKVFVRPGRDSAVFDFLLQPRKTGLLAVHVEAYEGDVCLVSRVLKPSAVAEAEVGASGVFGGIPQRARAGRLVVTTPLNVAVTAASAKPGARVGVWKPPGDEAPTMSVPTAPPMPARIPAGASVPDYEESIRLGGPVRSHSSMPWMKFGIAAALAVLCGPVIWYSTMRVKEHGQIDLPSKPVPPAVRVSVIPAEAEISIDGQPCPAPCNRELSPGTHEVRVFAAPPGVEPLTRRVTIPDRPSATIIINLEERTVTIR